MNVKKERAIYLSFSDHDCETWYKCPICKTSFGSWEIFRNPRNENGTKKYCPNCKEELDGLD